MHIILLCPLWILHVLLSSLRILQTNTCGSLWRAWFPSCSIYYIFLLILIIREIYWTWAIPEKLSGEVDVVGEVGEGNGESPSTFDTENLVDFVDWNLKMISIVRMTIVWKKIDVRYSVKDAELQHWRLLSMHNWIHFLFFAYAVVKRELEVLCLLCVLRRMLSSTLDLVADLPFSLTHFCVWIQVISLFLLKKNQSINKTIDISTGLERRNIIVFHWIFLKE